MRWTELFLDVVREGLGEPISLEFILPHTGDERKAIMAEIDEVALYHYRLKVAHESKLRRRFGRASGADMGGDDETTREIVNGVVRDVNFGDLMRADMLEMEAEEEEDSDDSYESSSEFETATDDDGESESQESSQRPSPPKDTTPRHAQEPSPSSSQPRLAFPPPGPTKSPSPSPAPSVTSPTSAGSRLRKLSFTLRKSRSMTFDSTRAPPSSNNAETPPVPPLPRPPVPPLPQSVKQSRSAAPLAVNADRTKPLPPPPPPQSSLSPATIRATSSPRRPEAPPPPAGAPRPSGASTAPKRHPTSHQNQNRKSPQAPKNQGKHQQASGHGAALKPPQLKKIPELLPIYVEMVSCNFTITEPSLFFPPQSSPPALVADLLTKSFIVFFFCRCAPRYAHGDSLMDSLVILVLDQRAVELVYEYNILLRG